MKAIVWTAYGPPEVLKLKEVEKPIPKADEVLIQIQATTVTAGDCELRTLKLPLMFRLPLWIYVGVSRPKRITILGQEMSGKIVAIGEDVKNFAVGDQVFGTTGFSLGAYAEYICLKANSNDSALAAKPENMSFAEAATVPTGGLEALHFLTKGEVGSGDKVLIVGAGGSIGTCGVQLAKHLGAEVIAVDTGEKLQVLESLGADRTVDFTREDVTNNGEKFDVIFDIVGKGSFRRSIRSLKKNGRYLLANPTLTRMLRGLIVTIFSSKKVITGTSIQMTESLNHIKSLIEQGYLKSVIDREFPMDRIAEAHAYVETGQKKGNVVVLVEPTEEEK